MQAAAREQQQQGSSSHRAPLADVRRERRRRRVGAVPEALLERRDVGGRRRERRALAPRGAQLRLEVGGGGARGRLVGREARELAAVRVLMVWMALRVLCWVVIGHWPLVVGR